MLPPFTIRAYTAADYPGMLQMWEEIGLGAAHRGDSPEVIERTLQQGGHLLLMTDASSGQIIGSSWLTVDGRRTYLHHFGIARDWQGKGLAKPLLEASLEMAKGIGFQLKLEVHHSNERAIRLYEGYGFSYLGDYDVFIIRDLLKG